MSELIIKKNHIVSHLDLLATVSAAALMASISVSQAAEGDADRPTVWIELGGQLERIDKADNIFAPSFFDRSPQGVTEPLVDAQKSPNYGFTTEGKISFVPEGSNWVFSAALRYGRANSGKHLHHESDVTTQVFPSPKNFVGDGVTNYHDSNLTVDFQVGKDVGLGMFGAGSRSVISAGVRFAQFNSNSDITLVARPYVHNSANYIFPSKYSFRNRRSTTYNDNLTAGRSTNAVGPSLSWDASVPVAGNTEHMMVDFDWGANAAVLFGRQKVRLHRRAEISQYAIVPGHYPAATYYGHSTQVSNPSRSHSVAIPNVGGFAGLSFRYANAKVSFGYRADFFFNAVDEGIDARKSSSLGFYGPFATISVGLGG